MSEESELKETKPVTLGDLLFIARYFEKYMNGTQAYLSLHPNSSYNNAKSCAAAILTKPNVKAEIRRRIDEMSMGADEAILVLTDHARGDISKFMDLSSVGWSVSLIQTDEDGNPILGADGKALPKPETRVIKKLKQRVTTVIGKGDSEDKEIVETEIELYDAQAAARDILKLHGRYKDSIDTSGKIEIVVRYANGDRNNTEAAQ